MQAGFLRLGLHIFAGIIFTGSAAAQGSVWRINAGESTARLYVASSSRHEARINVGVARLSGNVLQSAGAYLPGTVAFQIYPADQNGKPRKPQKQGGVSPAGVSPDSTTLAFRSKSIELLDEKTVLVRGDLTATYVSQSVEDDPMNGDSGPVFGPPVVHSVKRAVGFVFRPATARGARSGGVEWSASSIIPSDLFPELWNAVVTTDWPAFLVDEKCKPPSDGSTEFTGPVCTGKMIEPEPRTDLVCNMPASVGEDFSGVTCSGTPLSAVPKPDGRGHTGIDRPPHGAAGNSANEIEIELVIRLERMDPAPQKPPSGPSDPTARRYFGKSPRSSPA
ncbi:MAG TPA: hypothetical protein VFI38_02630 [Candidatus Acidoferrum sp.]|nr:hypothetical protein [Candidatus Acidoferrum sp.]